MKNSPSWPTHLCTVFKKSHFTTLRVKRRIFEFWREIQIFEKKMLFSNFQIQCFCTSKRNNVELHSVSPSTDLSPKTSPTDSTNKIDEEVSYYQDYHAIKSVKSRLNRIQ